MSIVLVNGTVASLLPREMRQANVSVAGGRIEWIGVQQPRETDSVVNCAGRIIMPGNVCAHTHLYSALARGMPAPPRTPHNFPEILEYVWWRLDRALDETSVRYSALVGTIDAVLAGTTTLIDHHASPNFIDGSLDVLAGAIDEVGARAVLCYEVTDRGGRECRDAGLRENERFQRANRRPAIRGMVGAHASFTLEDDSLHLLAELADELDTGVHIHVAEDVCDEDDSLRRSGKRTAARLGDAGILQGGSIGAHGVHLDVDELNVMRERRTWLVHNCRSNMNNAVGRAPVALFSERSALGTDGIDGDMFAESRAAYFRAREEDVQAYAEQYTDRLARGGTLASELFHSRIGALEPGAAADLMILSYDPPTPLASDNLAWHWMFALSQKDVESVMIAGRWVVRNRECVNVDEEWIRFKAQKETKRLWDRMEHL